MVSYLQVGELGTVSLTDTIDGGASASVSFSKSYDSPIVISFIATRNGGQSITSRVKDVTSSGCTIFMVEPDAGAHNAEDVNYIVMEAGAHKIDGVHFEAHAVNVDGTVADNVHRSGEADGGIRVSHDYAFATPPVVLHGLMTYNNQEFMETSVHSNFEGAFTVQQEAGGSGASGDNETIGWIAVEPGVSGSFNGSILYETGRQTDGTADGVDDASPHTISYVNSYGTTPDTVCKIQSTTANDGAWARSAGTNSTTTLEVYAEEDQVGDTERGHGDESFGWLTVESASALEYKQIGEEGLGTGTGSVNLPIFKATDLFKDFERVGTASEAGAFPVVDVKDAAFPYMRLNSATHGTQAYHNKPFVGDPYTLASSTTNDSIIDDFESGAFDTTIWNGTNTGTQTVESSAPSAAEKTYSLELYDGVASSSGVTSIDYPQWGDAVEFYCRAEAADDYMSTYLQFGDTSNTYHVKFMVNNGYAYFSRVNAGTETDLYSDFSTPWSANEWYYNKVRFIGKTNEEIAWYSEEVSTGTTMVNWQEVNSGTAQDYDGVRLAIDSGSTANYDYINTIINGA